MKTTNYEISKKLHELGFGINNTSLFGWFSKKAKTVGRWIVADGIKEVYNFDFYSFDLETILEALPAFVKYENEIYHFWMWNQGVGFYPNYDKYSGETAYDMKNGIFEFSDEQKLFSFLEFFVK